MPKRVVKSIANGIGAGFISYVLLRTATGHVKQLHPLMWVVAVAFLGYFAVGLSSRC
ncbi:MAG: hypothetical protein ABR528_10860 [Pseudonocardiaceae bacterium]